MRTAKERYADRKTLAILAVNGYVGCRTCGFTNIRALQFDHIEEVGKRSRVNIDGRTYCNEVNALRGGAAMVRAILNGTQDVTKLQVLCANCHCLKNEVTNE